MPGLPQIPGHDGSYPENRDSRAPGPSGSILSLSSQSGPKRTACLSLGVGQGSLLTKPQTCSNLELPAAESGPSHHRKAAFSIEDSGEKASPWPDP